MNKFAILLCLIVFTQQVTVEEVYDKAIYFFKGFAEGTNYKCYNVFVSQRTTMIKLINTIITEVKGGKSIKDAVMGHLTDFMKVPNLMDHCKVITLATKLIGFYSEKGIKDIGYALVNHNTDIYSYIQKIVSEKEYEVKAEYAGKLFKTITGLSVL